MPSPLDPGNPDVRPPFWRHRYYYLALKIGVLIGRLTRHLGAAERFVTAIQDPIRSVPLACIPDIDRGLPRLDATKHLTIVQ
jgi:hypothetical protein